MLKPTEIEVDFLTPTAMAIEEALTLESIAELSEASTVMFPVPAVATGALPIDACTAVLILFMAITGAMVMAVLSPRLAAIVVAEFSM